MNIDRLKRRVWDKKRGRMHYGDMDNLMFGLGGMLFWQFAYGSPEPISGDERDNYVSMDCTGRKDSEGTLIYEGDVVEIVLNDYNNQIPSAERDDVFTPTVKNICEVRYRASRGYIALVHRPLRYKGNCLRLKNGRDKVLGNRYQNPELLEANKK